jgi:hypothetical protein
MKLIIKTLQSPPKTIQYENRFACLADFIGLGNFTKQLLVENHILLQPEKQQIIVDFCKVPRAFLDYHGVPTPFVINDLSSEEKCTLIYMYPVSPLEKMRMILKSGVSRCKNIHALFRMAFTKTCYHSFPVDVHYVNYD